MGKGIGHPPRIGISLQTKNDTYQTPWGPMCTVLGWATFARPIGVRCKSY